MEKYKSCYPIYEYLTNVKSQPTEILNISCLNEDLSKAVTKKSALVTQKSLNIALRFFLVVLEKHLQEKNFLQ